MKILYIYPKTNQHNGGSICRRNNLAALKTVADEVVECGIAVDISVLGKIRSLLGGYKGGANGSVLKKICALAKHDSYPFIFFDGSIYGKIASALKKRTEAKILTFFHNCEYSLYLQSLKEKPYLARKLLTYLVFKNEKLALQKSDVCIFLNERDFYECQNRYSVLIPKHVSPIALKQTYEYKQTVSYRRPQKLLFVGSYFFPNIHGLLWFINEVLPQIDYSLIVVGKGFESEEFISHCSRAIAAEKLEAKGFVEDLSSEYENADVVIQPVFEGSGMKTKTAECLMYGKPLVSTGEGLSGYDISGLEHVYECNSADEFIGLLERLKGEMIPSFSAELYARFKERYSLEARIRDYKNLLEEL